MMNQRGFPMAPYQVKYLRTSVPRCVARDRGLNSLLRIQPQTHSLTPSPHTLPLPSAFSPSTYATNARLQSRWPGHATYFASSGQSLPIGLDACGPAERPRPASHVSCGDALSLMRLDAAYKYVESPISFPNAPGP